MLLAFALAATALLMIVKLGSEIAEGDTTAFDVAVLTQLRHATAGDVFWKLPSSTPDTQQRDPVTL